MEKGLDCVLIGTRDGLDRNQIGTRSYLQTVLIGFRYSEEVVQMKTVWRLGFDRA